MKVVNLSRNGAVKVRRDVKNLLEADCELLPKSFIPGEWIVLSDQKEKAAYLAYINLNADNEQSMIRVLSKIDGYIREKMHLQGSDLGSLKENEIGENYLKFAINAAIKRRNFFGEFEDDCMRLVYGDADKLPGLVIDKYCNIILVQINTEGIDRHRNIIQKTMALLYPENAVYFLDNAEERVKNGLPIWNDEYSWQNRVSKQHIMLKENGFKIIIDEAVIQKVGYYYDHRYNRHKFENMVKKISRKKIKCAKGLDLFTYAGSWGMHQLRAGVSHVDFVDQGKFSAVVEQNLMLNRYEGKGIFYRTDVYDFLDRRIEEKLKYDVITSDPPAFAKTVRNKEKAINGYLKLYEKIFQILESNAVLAVCSCTNYVSLEDLDFAVNEAFRRLKARDMVSSTGANSIQLVDIGMEGPDHPIASLGDKTHYLKYLLYILSE
ncbi:MAG: class I SAM-dependent methyltransferase [Oligoflexia bacterium]|nr:class I SAM-dependent methyltransferase [Oligoflexia bacterium]